MIQHTLWVEKYRTTKIEDFVANESFKNDIKKYIEKNDLPHLIFWGDTGCGKTTIIKLLAQNLDCDYLFLNASDENGIDVIREKVKNFASSASFKSIKLVLLDEAGNLSPEAQAALYNIIEAYSKTTRFLFTTNHIEKIAKPIQSRCVVFNLKPPGEDIVEVKCQVILNMEGIKFTRVDLMLLIDKFYPDIRKIINVLQQSSQLGKLSIENDFSKDYIQEILKILKTSKSAYSEIRQIITDSSVREFQSLFKALYDEYFDKPEINIILAEYQFKGISVPDKEINIMACIAKIIKELSNKLIKG